MKVPRPRRLMRKVLRRSIEYLAILLFSTFSIFVLIKLAPGDPYTGWSESLKQSFGVHDPLIIQYVRWASDSVLLDFGRSIRYLGEPVLGLVAGAYTRTTLIVLGALAAALVISVPFSYLLVMSSHTRIARWGGKVLELLSATPLFITGYLVFFIFITTFDYNLVLRDEMGPGGQVLFYSTVFLILGIGNGTLIELMKHLSAEIGRVRGSLFMRAVQARGANINRHLLRNIAIPLIDIVSQRFIFLLSGAVIIEYLFTIRGVGLLSIEAARARDYPLILGITCATVLVVLVAGGVARYLIRRIDPYRT